MSLLERIRSQPEHVRTRYVFLGALLATLVIGGIWSSTVPSRIASLSSVAREGADVAKEGADRVQNAKDNVANVIDSATDESLLQKVEEKQTEDDPVFAGQVNPYDKLRATTSASGADTTTSTPPTVTAKEPPATTTRVTTEQPFGTTTSTTTSSQSPRIILIGTTTSHKSE